MSLSDILQVLDNVKKENDIREVFEFSGISFEIGLITREQEVAANDYASSYQGLTNILVLDVVLLSYAIKKINAIEIKETLYDDTTKEEVEAPVFLRKQLMNMPSPIVDKMIGHYHIARNNLRKKLGLTVLDFDDLVEAAKKGQRVINEVDMPDLDQIEAMTDDYVDQQMG